MTLTPHLAIGLGIQMIYQESIVFDNLSITENFFTGSEIQKGMLLDRKEMRRWTWRYLST